MSLSKIGKNVVDEIQGTRKRDMKKMEKIEEETMVGVADNRNQFETGVQNQTIPSKVIIEEHDDPKTQSEKQGTESAGNSRSTTYDNSTYDDGTYENLTYDSASATQAQGTVSDSSQQDEELVYEDLTVYDMAGRFGQDTSIQVESDLAIYESSHNYALRIILPYYIRIINVLNAFLAARGETARPTPQDARDNNSPSTSNMDTNSTVTVADDPQSSTNVAISDDVFQGCSSGYGLTPEGCQSVCPYAYPEPQARNIHPRSDDVIINLLALLLAGEVIVIILCIMIFSFQAMEELEH